MGAYIPALRRYRWLLAAGAVVALLAAFSTLFRLPSFERRDPPTYTATARLLVTGANAPYVRTAVTQVQELARDGATRPGGNAGETTTVVQTTTPDITALVRAANLFPILIESDQVKAEREALFGPTEGTITSRAIYSVATPSRYSLSEVPVIQIFGSAPSERSAVDITRQTTAAFIRTIKRQQDAAGVPARQRILIQRIQAPSEALPSATPSPLVGVMAFIGVLLLFMLLAVVVDRLRPAPTAEAAIDGPSEGDASIEAVTHLAKPQKLRRAAQAETSDYELAKRPAPVDPTAEGTGSRAKPRTRPPEPPALGQRGRRSSARP